MAFDVPAGSQFDPGSFRDPSSRVFSSGDEVGRVLSAEGSRDWKAFVTSPLLERWTADGRFIETSEVQADDGRVTLRHARVPFWSYPYEWSFGMLRDAALLQLALQYEAVEHGLTLKDATPYNIQYVDSRPIFIDAGSFRPLEDGEPWLGYRQFCQTFLFPLMLQSYADVSFRPLLRGSLEGVTPRMARGVLRGLDIFRPGVLLDVVLQARADRTASNDDVRAELKSAGFSREMILKNLRRLEKVVKGLSWEPTGSSWSEYSGCAHVTEHREEKAAFVSVVVQERRRTLAWDLGANDGYHSRVLAEQTDLVVAIDGDQLVTDRLYGELAGEGALGILPLAVDLADPSPGLGWRGAERKSLEARGTPDLTLMLAVIHHLVIGSNLPLTEVIDWMACLGSEFVFEWVPPEDPMAKELMRNKKATEIHSDYEEPVLRRLLAQHFLIQTEAVIGGRTLFHLRPLSR